MISKGTKYLVFAGVICSLLLSACGMKKSTTEDFEVRHTAWELPGLPEEEMLQVIGMEEGEPDTLFLFYSHRNGETVKKEIVKCQTGEELSQMEKLLDMPEKFEGIIKNVNTDAQGNLYLVDGENILYVYGKEGELKLQYAFTGMVRGMAQDGQRGIFVMEEKSNSTVYRINPEEKQPVIIWELALQDANAIAFDADDRFYISTAEGLYRYDPNEQKKELLVSWLSCDIKGDSVKDLNISEEEIAVLTWDSVAYAAEIGILSQESAKTSEEAPDEEPHKEVLTLAAATLQPEVRDFIVEFNKTNPDYYVKVQTCGDGDYADFYTRLRTELLAGQGPDIVDLTGDFEAYVEQGILEDLTPYLEDGGLQREEYLPTAFTYFQRDDKCYGINVGFLLQTLIGDEKSLPEQEGWNLQECMEFVEASGDTGQFCSNLSKEAMLYFFLLDNWEHFVDEENGRCCFDGEEFQKLLEFINRYGADEQKPAGKGLVYRTGWQNALSYIAAEQYYNGDLKVIGYPTDQRDGIYIASLTGFGMNANSSAKEGVWEFLKALLSDDCQEGEEGSWGMWTYQFPVKRSGLEAKFEKDNKMANYNEYWDIGAVMTGASVRIEPGDSSQLSELLSIMEKAKPMPEEQELEEIVQEEAAAYFEGQKSVSQTAEAIQLRAQIYISEKH